MPDAEHDRRRRSASERSGRARSVRRLSPVSERHLRAAGSRRALMSSPGPQRRLGVHVRSASATRSRSPPATSRTICAVAQEHDAVGQRRGAGVVGDHDDRLALVDEAPQQPEDHRRRLPSRGCRWARRRAATAGGAAAPGRWRRAAARRPRARTGGGRRGRRGRRARATRRRAPRDRAGARPATSAGSSTFSAAVSVGSRLKNWKTKPKTSPRNRVSAPVVEVVVAAAVELGRARRRPVEAAEDVQQRALARARRAP